MYPGTPANYIGLEKDKDIAEVPTIPSDMEQLAKTLENLDLKGIAEDVRKTLAGIEGLVNKPELAEAITNLNKTLEDFGKLARNVDSRVEPLATSIEGTMKDTQKLVRKVEGQVEPLLGGAQRALEQAENTLAAIEDMTGRNSALRNKVEQTLTAVRGAARSFRVLADYLERNPDALLFGKGEPGGQ
jgi:paraquat-inducible protein B